VPIAAPADDELRRRCEEPLRKMAVTEKLSDDGLLVRAIS
jgi:hypothetical protein